MPRAFVADVLLYDRLVIPTLPEKAAEHEWPDTWNLPRQRTMLSDLGNLAITIPWDDQRRAAWQSRFDDARKEVRGSARAEATEAVANDVRMARDPQYYDLPYRITRKLLQDCINDDADDKLLKKLRATQKVRPGSLLEAVSAYTSFDDFVADVPVANSGNPINGARPNAPTSVFGWKFFLPESEKSGEDEDRRLLEQAIKLATRVDFIEMREDFYKWWSDVAGSGMSATEVRHDMEKRIAEYQKLMTRQSWTSAARYAIKIADAFSGGLGLVNEVAAAGAEAFLGSADVLADDKLVREKVPARLKVGAIFHDARVTFGWKAQS
jgi:hypothetical protein